MFPLQIGNADTIFVVAIGIALFVIVIILILYGVRRSTAITDELAKDRQLKSIPIKPAANLQVKEKQQPSPPTDEVRDLESNSTLQAELQDNKTKLQHSLLEIATLRENENTVQEEIADLRTEVRSLQESLLTSRQEIQKLRTSLNQDAKTQTATPPRDLPTRDRQEIRKVAEQHTGGWTASLFGNSSPRRICRLCGRSLGPRDRYCDSCGRSIPSPM